MTPVREEDIHLIVCGLPSEQVVTAVHQAELPWYLEPVAEDLEQLSWFLSRDTPLIRGGAHNVVVIAEHAGPPVEVARWLAILSAAPERDVTVVLLSEESNAEQPRVLEAHPDLHPETTSLSPGRIAMAGTGTRAQEWVAALSEVIGTTEPTVAIRRYPSVRAAEPVRSAHVVLVLSAASGAGASSIALALGGYVAAAHRPAEATRALRVAVVDLDLRNPAMALLTALEPRDLSVDLVSAEPSATPTAVAKLLGGLHRRYDVLLIDAQPVHQVLVEAASQILLVTNTSLRSARRVRSLFRSLTTEHGVPAQYIGVIWNRVHSGLTPPVEEIQASPELRQLQFLPDTGADHTRLGNAGRFLRILWESPDWAARIHLLAEALFGPDSVRPLTAEVARLLPHLHRDGRPRTAYRLRRNPITRRYRVTR